MRGRAAVLTVNGQAEVVVQGARAYRQLLEKVEAAEQLRDFRCGSGEYRAFPVARRGRGA